MGSYLGWGLFFAFVSMLATGLIHYYYTKRAYRQIPTATHCFICLSNLVCILPFPMLVLDVVGAFAAKNEGLEQNPTRPFMKTWWVVVFLLTQIMAWIVLPIAQEFDNSGDFTTGAKLKQSLKDNLKLYTVLGIVVGALMAYVIFLKGAHTTTDILNIILASANAFGLFLLVLFLSYGLVGLPKSFWRDADPGFLLRYYYFIATDMHEDLDLIKMDLTELRAELVAMGPRIGDDEKVLLDSMLDTIDETAKIVPMTSHTSSSRSRIEAATDTNELSRTKLVRLNTKIKRSTKVATRLYFQFESVKRMCTLLDAVLSGNSEHITARPWYWNGVRKPLFRILAVVFFILTLIVLWCEAMLPFTQFTTTDLSVMELAVKNTKTQFLASIGFLTYMASASYWATFQFKVLDIYHVVPSYSDAASLCFTATFLTRLILPLCYNFLWIADLTSTDQLVTYSQIFGRMDVVDFLGPFFNRFFPVFIPVMAILIQSRFFEKLMMSIGIERHDISDVTSEAVQDKIRSGQALVAQQTGHELVRVEGLPEPETEVLPKAMKKAPGERYSEWKAKRAKEEKSGTAIE